MNRLVRAWLAFAAIGAGVIHLAMTAGVPITIGIVLAVLGIAELAWGVQVLVMDALPVPRVARLAALAPVLVWGLAVVAESVFAVASAAAPPIIPMAIASIFDVTLASGLSVLLRRGSTADADRVAGGWRYAAGLVAGGLAVSLLVTPALAFIPDAPPGTPPLINIHSH